jgi:hypothetical protein
VVRGVTGPAEAGTEVPAHSVNRYANRPRQCEIVL